MTSTTPCDHKWKWVKDWYGDPTIPHGTCDCSHWECKLCGDVAGEDEIDNLDKPGPDPDYERDRRIDDALTGD